MTITRNPGSIAALACAIAALVSASASAQAAPKMKTTTDIPAEITTPDSVETRLGTLKFLDGFQETALAPVPEDVAPSADAASIAPAEPPATTDAAELAKQLANPLASLVVIPFQQDIDFGIGPDEGVKATLNIQPLIPIDLTHGTNLISRTIFSVIHMNSDAVGKNVFGLGDTLQSFFVSPKHPTSGGIIWGAGPVILVPTATDPVLGGQKWGVGPTFVALKQKGGWTAGTLINHIWSFAGKASRDDISQTYVEPFAYYTWPNTVSVSASVETVYDWKTKDWTAPFNVLVSKVVRLGNQDASIAGGVRYFLQRPVGGPKWGLRLSLTLLFPKH